MIFHLSVSFEFSKNYLHITSRYTSKLHMALLMVISFINIFHFTGFSSGVIGAMTLLGNVSGATIGVFFTVKIIFLIFLLSEMLVYRFYPFSHKH